MEHCARVAGSAQHLVGANLGVGGELLVRVAFDQLEGAVDGLDAGPEVVVDHHAADGANRREASEQEDGGSRYAECGTQPSGSFSFGAMWQHRRSGAAGFHEDASAGNTLTRVVAHQEGPRLGETARNKGRDLCLEIRTGVQWAVTLMGDAEPFPDRADDPAGGRVIDILSADFFRGAIDTVVVVMTVGHCMPPMNSPISSLRRVRAR